MWWASTLRNCCLWFTSLIHCWTMIPHGIVSYRVWGITWHLCKQLDTIRHPMTMYGKPTRHRIDPRRLYKHCSTIFSTDKWSHILSQWQAERRRNFPVRSLNPVCLQPRLWFDTSFFIYLQSTGLYKIHYMLFAAACPTMIDICLVSGFTDRSQGSGLSGGSQSRSLAISFASSCTLTHSFCPAM
jgi:hypothetical protein